MANVRRAEPSAALQRGKLDLAARFDRVAAERVGADDAIESAVTNYETAKTSDTGRYARFFHALLERGVYFPPSQFEACFVSLAHTVKDIDSTIRAAREAFKEAPASA